MSWWFVVFVIFVFVSVCVCVHILQQTADPITFSGVGLVCICVLHLQCRQVALTFHNSGGGVSWYGNVAMASSPQRYISHKKSIIKRTRDCCWLSARMSYMPLLTLPHTHAHTLLYMYHHRRHCVSCTIRKLVSRKRLYFAIFAPNRYSSLCIVWLFYCMHKHMGVYEFYWNGLHVAPKAIPSASANCRACPSECI